MKAAETARVAESRGYAKGYQAGRRKASQDAGATLWLRVFEVSLPFFLGANNWTRGEKKLTLLKDRVDLASEAADLACAEARKRGVIGEASK